MINKERIREYVKSLSSLNEEELQVYDVFLDFAAVSTAKALNDKSFEEDERIVFLAAARAFYLISGALEQRDGISSFKAGDITITENKSGTELAGKILEKAQAAAQELISSCGSFAFMSV